MYSRQLEQIATQHTAELRSRPAAAARTVPASTHHQRRPIRTQTGWALVSLGLRLAESGSR